MSAKKQLAVAAFLMALAVALGAFGAHALKATLPAKALQTWQTANEYHIYHAIGLLIIGLTGLHGIQHRLVALAYPVMLLGLFIFCGSLYALALSNIALLGAITPVGGLLFIASWIVFGIGLLRNK